MAPSGPIPAFSVPYQATIVAAATVAATYLGARAAAGMGRDLRAGIFARLTLRDGKPKYLADASRFIGYIRATTGRYRELTPLLRLVDKVEGSAAATGFLPYSVGIKFPVAVERPENSL